MDVTSDVASKSSHESIAFYFRPNKKITSPTVILLPVCLLWNLKIGLCKKFLLGGIFSLTVFTMIASITRIIVVTSKAEVLDESWKMTWIAIEMSVGKLLCPPTSLLSPQDTIPSSIPHFLHRHHKIPPHPSPPSPFPQS